MDLALSTELVRAGDKEAATALQFFQEVARHKELVKTGKLTCTEEASPVFLTNWVKGSGIGLVTEAR